MSRDLQSNIRLFIVACAFYTRLPVKAGLPTAVEMNRAVRFFPLMGFIVAGISFLFLLAGFGATGSPLVAALVFWGAGIIVTGAFHEDGFADYCDGFGGFTREKILSIMKDSRVGTYGVAGLSLLILLKTALLAEIVSEHNLTFSWQPVLSLLLPLLFIAAGSRWLSALYMYRLNYVGDPRTAKSKYAAETISLSELAAGLVTVLIPAVAVFWLNESTAYFLGVAFFAIYPVWKMFGRGLNRRLGGYNGDCLGAAQQLFELWLLFLFTAWCFHGAKFGW